jgi:HEAT repeat protein
MILGPDLQIWADAHNVSVNTAGIYARYDYPTKVLALAMTGDPRGIPLFQRALQSRNYLIVAFAAKGLAQIQDRQSIPLIIAAAKKAPTGYNTLIAEALVYFDDAQAQSAVDTYMPKEKVAMDREARSRGKGIFGWSKIEN